MPYIGLPYRGGVGGFGYGLLGIVGSERGEGSIKGMITVKGSEEFLGQFVRFSVE